MFRRGKKATQEIDEFAYYLETNLSSINRDLNDGSYQHGRYRTFIVTDNKRRVISVASVRDRVVHRLLYEYLVKIYDKTFICDVWSCRKGKGVLDAIKRAQSFLKKFNRSCVWRADITKFFDNVDHAVLLDILNLKIKEIKSLRLLNQVIDSYCLGSGVQRERGGGSKKPHHGIPIGNLTSQIFANIYLNELDRFMVHQLRPQAYLRYGDDFIVVDEHKDKVGTHRLAAMTFLGIKLKLIINPKNDIIIPARIGLKFLGVEIFPKGRRLKKRSWNRANSRLNHRNIGSYWGLVSSYGNSKKIKQFLWKTVDFYDQP